MMPKRSNKLRRSGKTENQTPVPVMNLTPAESFDRMLGRSNDSCVFRGKTQSLYTVTTVATSVLDISPGFLGSRASALAGVYSRFRIKGLLIKVAVPVYSNVPLTAISFGIVDDTGSTASAPTNLTGVTDLRASVYMTTANSDPDYIFWTPIDKTAWYYTTRYTGSDPREVIPGTVYAAASTGTITCAVEFEYTLVFSGADG
jgi:hypothetical protein